MLSKQQAGDYFRRAPNDKKRAWFCPALDQKGLKVDGTPNAYNAAAWVETDAVNSMLYYLSSGDFYRMCNDQSRELELNCAGASDAEAREELHRASNVLTSYYDIQVDGTLREAIRAHLNDRDDRWLMGRPGVPPTPPTTTKRTRSYHAGCGGGGGGAGGGGGDKAGGKENSISKMKIPLPNGAALDKWKNSKNQQHQAKDLVLRRSNSSVLPRGSNGLYL